MRGEHTSASLPAEEPLASAASHPTFPDERRPKYRNLRSPWHAARCLLSKKVEVTIEAESGEVVCTRRLSNRADCLDITHAAYKYDSKRLLAPRVPLGADGGIAAFTRRMATQDGKKAEMLHLNPGSTLQVVNPWHERKITLRIVSHASFTRQTFSQFVHDEKCRSELRALRQMRPKMTGGTRLSKSAARLEPYDPFKKQPMEIWTHWDERAHCVGFFRPYSENLTHTPASKRPGGIERMWGRFEIVPTTCYPLVSVTPHIIRNHATLPSLKAYTCHPSLAIMDVAEAAISASKGRYLVYEKNCQTAILETYTSEHVGLDDYASQFNNMLREKGIQTQEKTARRSSEHYSIEPFPDKGPLGYCGRELCMVGCGGGS